MFLHPGLIPVLKKLDANELDVAKLIRDGELTSPQRFHNMSLFNIRITGTGVSYRPSLDEYVFRRQENYLTDEFLQRCNGLTVIMNHPKDSLLNSEEFADRVVGSVTLPYIKENEVWAIAKIYDDEAIRMMSEQPMSTSPAVLLSKSHVIKHDGKTVLVEGEPTLLDHIAICRSGVWDKSDQTNIGVESVTVEDVIRKDSKMADSDTKEVADAAARADAEKARADAEKRADAQYDELLKGVDSAKALFDAAMKRLDAMEESDKKAKEEEEKERKDATNDKEDKEDKDEKEEKEEKEEGDKARELAADKRADAADRRARDAETRAEEAIRNMKALEDRFNSLEQKVIKPFSDSDRSELIAAQARADSVLAQFGEEAPRFLIGETPKSYRARLANLLQKHSPQWSGVKLDDFTGNDSGFKVIENQIYADAMSASKRPTNLEPGKLYERVRTAPTGHRIVEFFGNESFVTQFRKPMRRVRAFNGGTRQ